ncbi:MAG: sigma-70 family RNA polymerase sigma factor [Saprospiraceae bacterium]|nr:sigma-70 family RNA polymerase sigma factor [Saprospiraceae bacterium]
MEKNFIDIVNKHKGLIFKVCNMYGADAEDRKDLFQEILLQMWKSFKSFRGEASISTWAYRIAINTAVTYSKKIKRNELSGSSVMNFEVPDLMESQEKEERSAWLHQAISQLDKIEKSVILLYLEDKSYEEISEITGLTRSNVGVRINRIKTKLSKIIKL